MFDISAYEGIGAWTEPMELTVKNHRDQAQLVERRDVLRRQTSRLTWEQYRAGAPCPGCGEPYLDEIPWVGKGTMYFTEEERTRYDAEEFRYKERHPDCHAVRMSVSGSLTLHCGDCCPPPPLSPGQIESLRKILGSPTPATELMQWKLRLYCGHTVVRTAHKSHKSASSAFLGWGQDCSVCEQPAAIVDAKAVGLLESPPVTRPVPKPARVTRAQLEQRVLELEAEVLRLKGSAGAATSGDSKSG